MMLAVAIGMGIAQSVSGICNVSGVATDSMYWCLLGFFAEYAAGIVSGL